MFLPVTRYISKMRHTPPYSGNIGDNGSNMGSDTDYVGVKYNNSNVGFNYFKLKVRAAMPVTTKRKEVITTTVTMARKITITMSTDPKN
jgi:hypothetical protein